MSAYVVGTLLSVPALRTQRDIWVPWLLDTSARANAVILDVDYCDRCGCKLSRFRHGWERHCLPCLAVIGYPLTGAAPDGYETRPAAQVKALRELEERLERKRQEKATRPKRPLTADQLATRERFARWRAERQASAA